jgi:hypothetical protein
VQLGQFLPQLGHRPLQQVESERAPTQVRLRAGNGIEDSDPGVRLIECRCVLVEDGVDLARDMGGEGNLREEQGFEGQVGVHERIAPSVGGEPVLEIAPRPERVNSLALDHAFEQAGRRGTRDSPQLQVYVVHVLYGSEAC